MSTQSDGPQNIDTIRQLLQKIEQAAVEDAEKGADEALEHEVLGSPAGAAPARPCPGSAGHVLGRERRRGERRDRRATPPRQREARASAL